MDDAALLPLIASILLGSAIFVLIWSAIAPFGAWRRAQENRDKNDLGRAAELRKLSLCYRWFEPLILNLAEWNRYMAAAQLPEIGRQIVSSGGSRAWNPEEWLAVIEIQCGLAAPLFIAMGMQLMGAPGIVLGVLWAVLLGVVLRRRLAKQAAYRLWRIKQRLPYLLDLLTLLMEAGATFLNALRDAVAEFRHHPAGVEFGRVLAEMNMGKSRTAALEALRDRLADDEITSIVGSVIQGENLGTPLGLLFRTQADVLRTKRSQRAETMAGEAAVQMLLPAVLIMAAAVLIILGPFVLNLFTGELLR